MPPENEVYAKAPLVLVTAQLGYAHEPRLNIPEIRDVVAEELRSSFPVLDVESITQENGEITRQLRATNERRSITVVVNSQAVTVDATEYEHFWAFSDLLKVCFGAIEKAIGRVYVERAGLRYVDEVRPTDITSTRDWEAWIAPPLVSAAALLPGRSPETLRGVTVYEVAERTIMTFQWGEVIGHSVVAPSKVRKPPEPGRFFVLDADAFWVPETPSATAPTEMVWRFKELHAPVSEVFQASLTSKTRSMFRGDSK